MIRIVLAAIAVAASPAGAMAQSDAAGSDDVHIVTPDNDPSHEVVPSDDGYFSGPSGTEDGFSLTPELDLNAVELGQSEQVEQPEAARAPGAVLRGLDKVTGDLTDLELKNGQTQTFGRLTVTLEECRFPVGNPSGDAYAYLVIRADDDSRPIFAGWMIASSPALNALDHPRYDVWVLRCATS